MKILIEKTITHENGETSTYRLECPAHFTLGHIADLWGATLGGDFPDSGEGFSGVPVPNVPRFPVLTGSAALQIPVC